MKQAFLLSEQGVVNIYFIRDERPRIQWLIDLGIPNFSVFMLELPIPLDNPTHTQIIFHEGMALILQQIKVFLAENEFEEDGGVIKGIMKAVKDVDIDYASTETMYGYEILFPLTKEFYTRVMDRLVRQKAASRETDAANAVWKGPTVGGRYVSPNEGKMVKMKDQKALEDARKIIQRYKNTIYKNTPGPMYVILYDRNGMPRGVSRVTNKGLTKWAKTKWADEFAKVPKDLLNTIQDIKEIEPHPDPKPNDYGHRLNPRQHRAEERLELLRKRLGHPLKVLGKGSSRVVVEVTPTVCLKLALNSAGVSQNKVEYETYEKVEDCAMITRIFFYDPDWEWLVCEKAIRKATEDDFDRSYGVTGPYDLLGQLTHPQHYPPIKDPSALKALKFLLDKGLLEADMGSMRQWGLVERRGERYPVLVDYGLDGDVWGRHYGSDWGTHIKGEFWLDGGVSSNYTDCSGNGDYTHESYALESVITDKWEQILTACHEYMSEAMKQYDPDEVEAEWHYLKQQREGDPEVLGTLLWGAVPWEISDQIFNDDYELFTKDIRNFYKKHYNQIHVIDTHFGVWQLTSRNLNTIIDWLFEQAEQNGDSDIDSNEDDVYIEQAVDHKWTAIKMRDLIHMKQPGQVWRTKGMVTAAEDVYEVDNGPGTDRHLSISLVSRFGNWKIGVDVRPGSDMMIAKVELDTIDRTLVARGRSANDLEQDLKSKIDWHYIMLKKDLQREIAEGHKPRYNYHDLELDNSRLVQEMLYEVERHLGPEQPKTRW